MRALFGAAVAQLVERNLAKVEVESSRLFCRSKIKRESELRFPFFVSARVVKSVDTRDLKSLALRVYGFKSRPGYHIGKEGKCLSFPSFFGFISQFLSSATAQPLP